MADKKHSYDEAYQKLLMAYVARLKSNLDDIQIILAQINELTRDDLRRAQHLAHGLAGSGATFGFPEITQAGRRADDFLTKSLHAPASNIAKLDEKSCSELEKLMFELHSACFSAIATA